MKRTPNLLKLAQQLSAADLKQLTALIGRKSNPRVKKLEVKRDRLAAQLAKLDREIASLDGTAPVKRRGRPGRAVSATSGASKPGKSPKAPGKASKRSPAEQKTINDRMAKVRAARWGQSKPAPVKLAGRKKKVF